MFLQQVQIGSITFMERLGTYILPCRTAFYGFVTPFIRVLYFLIYITYCTVLLKYRYKVMDNRYKPVSHSCGGVWNPVSGIFNPFAAVCREGGKINLINRTNNRKFGTNNQNGKET
ncbi:hypothetical protein A8C56_17370 [Niabella ginsenosidivorans]|uniref:Uncharacterized protein n=1 Tax=Niabella ginsenosidivorans TaxID=1176587 RepID=A0A1A9I5A0_9BACT|nr:hypothetical protein [Niabella ginsenosidivorans]ANH82505.1 hypothetical protein A8C56_17370 [Niabella ginsenosidivorans]